MLNRRKHRRYVSPEPFEVYHSDSGELLGLLVDLSVGGLLLRADTCLESGAVYELKIKLKERLLNSKTIRFSAEIVWANHLKQQGMSCAGFLITEISDDDLERIEQLLDAWEIAMSRAHGELDFDPVQSDS